LCYSRTPLGAAIVQEKEWWADEDERVLGAVLLDNFDHDWSWIVLGRDEKGLFRGIDQDVSLSSQRKARAYLRVALENHARSGAAEFPQYDNDRKKNEILIPVVSERQLHENFRILIAGKHHSAARNLIREIAYSFVDIDGNYKRDFQTSGFNGRLWELYLYAFLHEQRCEILREWDRPDFCIAKAGIPIGIEATTVNPTQGERPPSPTTPEEMRSLRRDYVPIKFGSVLYSKLAKRYWELPHMNGVPFIIAVHDFLHKDSMTWTAPGLEDYLYGVRASWEKDEAGILTVTEHPIEEHVWNTKRIPSGFFKLPGAEHVSAVLFSNSATMSKFDRMGKLAGFGDPDVMIFRVGTRHNWDPNATEPDPFSVEVDPEKYSEKWTEGVRVFHNPNALTLIPREVFPGCSHHYFKDGRRSAILPENHIYASHTFIWGSKEESPEFPDNVPDSQAAFASAAK
jgi:hypothetical protein